jgi:mono/diheme cytochrome c family protein
LRTNPAYLRMSRAAGLLLLALVSVGCRQDMHDQPKYSPLEKSGFFADRRASRPIPAGSVARGLLKDDTRFHTGMVNNRPITEMPVPVTAELLKRGQERFNIYCVPCHDATGSGEGMIVRRGMKRPTSYHTERLRTAPVGYFYDVITNGYGAMYDYSAQIEPADRWAIVAYIRVLQRAQSGTINDVPPDQVSSIKPAGGSL